MKVVMLEVPTSLLAERHRQGLDARDEVWEGVLHMVPPPSFEHQRLCLRLASLFLDYFTRNSLGLICSGLAVRDPRGADSYRIPEWFALHKSRSQAVRPDSSFVDEGPDVVVEVRSPGDETDDKTPFYDKLGVGEILIIDRDTKRVDILRRTGGALRPALPDPDGWLHCEGLRASFRRAEKDGRPVVFVRFEIGREEFEI